MLVGNNYYHFTVSQTLGRADGGRVMLLFLYEIPAGDAADVLPSASIVRRPMVNDGARVLARTII